MSCDNFVDPKATRRVPLLMAFLFALNGFLEPGNTGVCSIITEVRAQNSIKAAGNTNKKLSRVISNMHYK